MTIGHLGGRLSCSDSREIWLAVPRVDLGVKKLDTEEKKVLVIITASRTHRAVVRALPARIKQHITIDLIPTTEAVIEINTLKMPGVIRLGP